MKNTQRLYEDPYLRTFSASVCERRQVDGRPAVVLDATAFYPTGGGQPHDTGTLNGIRVLDVRVADDGAILHLLAEPLTAERVEGVVDWERRFDHMQQHTGQHILSQAFLQTCGAETVSFHMGSEDTTIDLNCSPPSSEVVAAAERLANQVVMEHRPVSARFVDEAELPNIPLRKMPNVTGAIRIVEVEGFDWSPCGGTHVCNTGAVGPIKVTRVERRKKLARVHFLCGWRALADHARKQEIVRELTARLTTGEEDLLAAVERMEAEIKRLQKSLAGVRMELLEHQVADWLAGGKELGRARVVRLAFDECDVKVLREAAHRLIATPGVVALLAARQPRVQFVFARSEGVDADMGRVMRAACAAVGGRGGGRPQFAQGWAPPGADVERALEVAWQQLMAERHEG